MTGYFYGATIQLIRVNTQKRGGIGMNQDKIIKFTPSKEVLLAILSVFVLWGGYYGAENIFEDNMLLVLLVSVIGMICLCIAFPTWWIAVHQKEGIEGLGITTKKLGVSLVFAIILGAWRFLELRQYIGQEGFVTCLLFNGLAIWEVVFIYGWLFTRYAKAFGKLLAVVLTVLSVAIYHIGTLSIENILILCVTIGICACVYAFTNNLFTLWPIYWMIGCSASTLRSGMIFEKELVVMSAMILIIQIAIIAVMQILYLKKKRKEIKACA